MAIKQERWDKAKVMFEQGDSLSKISNALGIDGSTVSKKAKKQGWIKGKNQGLIIDAVRLDEQKSMLNQEELDSHDKEVARIIKSRQETNTIARMGQSLIASQFKAAIKTNGNPKPEPISMENVKRGIEANDKASITLGVNPRHAQSLINNTNAQQNNTQNVGGVMKVPLANDNWESVAVESQSKLINEQ